MKIRQTLAGQDRSNAGWQQDLVAYNRVGDVLRSQGMFGEAREAYHIIGFQDQWDAQRFRVDLKERMEKFALSLNEGKTRLIEFGRYANERRKKTK